MQGNRETYGLDIGVGPRGGQTVREESGRGKWDPLCAPVPEKVARGAGKVYYNGKWNKGSRDIIGKVVR